MRLDIQRPGAVTEAFSKLVAYYSGLLVPPTLPTNGVAITEAQLEGWERAPAANLATAWSPAASAMRMVERHFGRVDRLATAVAAQDIDAGVLERLQRFADRVTAARQDVARDEAVRSRKR